MKGLLKIDGVQDIHLKDLVAHGLHHHVNVLGYCKITVE